MFEGLEGLRGMEMIRTAYDNHIGARLLQQGLVIVADDGLRKRSLGSLKGTGHGVEKTHCFSATICGSDLSYVEGRAARSTDQQSKGGHSSSPRSYGPNRLRNDRTSFDGGVPTAVGDA